MTFPQKYEVIINKLLQKNGLSLSDRQKIAKSILKLSDFYIDQRRSPTPWQDDSTLIAQLCYFFPLNYMRAAAVIEQIKKLKFFADDEKIKFVDFGSGLGTMTLALLDNMPNPLEGLCIESHRPCRETFVKLAGDPKNIDWRQSLSETTADSIFLCYSLLELQSLPSWLTKFENIIIIEPSDSRTGRELLTTRKNLIAAGYKLWAPCTHQNSCPLEVHSKSDWCHHRSLWQAPQWFREIEKHLPIKNNTLTFSYLVASRRSPPSKLADLARLTGDLQEEKGKSKQMVCRGTEREFLAWLHKDGKPKEFLRGSLVSLEKFEKKSNEIRVQEILGPDECDSLLDS